MNMSLKPVTFVFLFFNVVFLAKCYEEKNKQISESFDLIESFTMSPIISAYICGTREYQATFWKNLSARYPVNYVTKINLGSMVFTNQLYIIDLTCDGANQLLIEGQKLELFKNPTKWLLLGNTSQLPNLHYGLDSQIFVMDLESKSNITMVYKRSQKSKTFTKDYIQDYRDFSIANRRNLMGNTIKISIVITNPDSLNHLWDYRYTHIDAISKLNYILANILMDYLNASREFMVQPTWGYKNSTTGLYNGMVGDLQRGVADLGGTPLFFTSDRVDIIDYIAATTPTHMKFIFRAPPLSYVTNVFTLPFDTSVWHYCFVMVAVVVVFIYIIVIWEWKNKQFRNTILDKHVDALRPNIFEVIMLQIGAITQQGSYVEPQSYSGRIITIFTFTTLMFLYTSYSANIVALLQSTTDSITTLEDLLKFRIKLGVEDITYAHYYFETAKEPIRKAIYQQKVAPRGQKANFFKAQEGIRRVREGFFGFHVELNTGYKIISDMFQEGEKCGLKEIDYENFIEPWLAIQKRTPYKEVMKIGMRKLHEHGIQNREVRRVYTRRPQCHAGGSNFGSVGLIDCYSAFLLFGIGVASAFVIFGTEIFIRKLKLGQQI